MPRLAEVALLGMIFKSHSKGLPHDQVLPLIFVTEELNKSNNEEMQLWIIPQAKVFPIQGKTY